MDCEICEEIFKKINDIDSQTKPLEDAKKYYKYRLEYVQMSGVHKETIKLIRERYEISYSNWILIKAEQENIHEELTKHYRETHLNGENSSV